MGVGTNNLFHASTKTMSLEEAQNSHTSLQDDGWSKIATHNCKKEGWTDTDTDTLYPNPEWTRHQ